MFIKKIDLLSPPNSLYYKGENIHSSIFSGILTIIAYLIIIASIVYYVLEFINKEENPNTFFFTKYVEDAGIFPVNSSSMFSFIQMMRTDINSIIQIDFDKIEIIGLEETIDNYVNNADLAKYNHWLYGPCNNESDIEGIAYLINQDFLPKSACIRKYYSKESKKYYETDDKDFRWPVILHGFSNPNRTIYSVLVKKCENTEMRLKTRGKCASEDEISEYLKHISINFKIIDHLTDILNYNEFFIKYLYNITVRIIKNSYTINHLKFNPALMRTDNGIIYDNIIEQSAFFFSKNERIIIQQEQTAFIAGFNFCMENIQQYYERHYKRLQNVLSDIGGFGFLILMIAKGINYLVCNYIILLDTEELILKADETNFRKKGIIQKPTIYRKANEIMPTSKRTGNNNINDSQQSSNNQKMLKDGIDIVEDNYFNNKKLLIKHSSLSIYLKKKNKLNRGNNNKNDKNEKENEDKNDYIEEKIDEDSFQIPGENEDYRQRYFNNNNQKIKEENTIEGNKEEVNKNNKTRNNNNNNIMINSENKNINSERGKLSNFFNSNKNNNKQKPLNENNDINIKMENKNSPSEMIDEDDDYKPIEKQNFNWFNYLYYIILCRKNNPKMKYYEDFRAQIISEENLIQNHLNVYKIFKACNLENPPNLLNKLKIN